MSFPLSFSSYEAIPISKDPARVLVRWDLKPNRADLSDFEFYIDRGDAPDQLVGFQSVDIDGNKTASKKASTASINQSQISGAISAADFYQWVDATPDIRNLDKNYYYRIRLRRISTQEEVVTPPFSWSGELDLMGLYIVEEHNFLLEDVTGVPCFIYIRRRGGIACGDCFDPIQKKRTASFCNTCYGTNWAGGFYNPLDAYVDLTPNPVNSTIADWGEVKKNETDMLLSNYPELSPGDLVRELRSNRLWRVVACRQTQKRRVPMLQYARVVEVSAGDVEYRIALDTELALSKIKELDRMRQLREF